MSERPLPPPRRDEALAAPQAPTALPPKRSPGHRWLRLIAPVGVVALAFGGFAVAQAAIDDSGNDSPRDLVENAPPNTLSTEGGDDSSGIGGGGGDAQTTVSFVDDAIADGATQTFAAGAAGSVTISRTGTTLTVVSAGPDAGWTSEIETGSGPEVEVKFTNGTTRVDLSAETEDGAVRVRVRERALVADPGTTENAGPGSVHSDRDGVENDGMPEVDDDHGSGSGTDDASEIGDDHGGPSGSGSSGSSGSGKGGSGSGRSDD